MKIRISSIPVLNQDVALKFYTEILGFVKKHDIPMGGDARWITLVAKGEEDGVELLLEPAPVHFEPSKVYQKALFEAGIPWTQFNVDDVDKEYERLIGLGVNFKTAPMDAGTVKIAVFDDTCGNYIQLVQML